MNSPSTASSSANALIKANGSRSRPLESRSPLDTLQHAVALQGQGQHSAAKTLLHQVLDAEPHNAAALYSLAVIALHGGDHQQALELCERGLSAAPTAAILWYAKGAALQGLDRTTPALEAFDRALAIKPDYLEVLVMSGVLLRHLFRHHEALQRFNTILKHDPNHQVALNNLGIMLTEYKQSEEAIRMFRRLVELNPDYDFAVGLLFYERMHICDWTDFEALTAQITAGVRAGKRICKSLSLMSASDQPGDHLQAARIFADHICPVRGPALHGGRRYGHRKIRLAYLSPDLREHPVTHLLAGVFEGHDKSRFETFAVSIGIDDGSRLRQRVVQAFDHFIDARAMGSLQVARLIREHEIDVLVDLGGYTADTRTDILAYRPAPVQVNYLGYPGSMGTDYHDYIIADRHVIPPEHQSFYSERVAYMPDSYLPTDGSIRISAETPTRAACGLPETGFVFCAFSHEYKISPAVFGVWMRLLQAVPGSVLWLMARGALAQANLRKEARARGVDPERLIFAKRVKHVEDHLARYRVADLFLDTNPYNAHTTAADALMAGLPVVTYWGNAFPSRVAGSVLSAMGLAELVAGSLPGYEALALSLARDPQALAKLRARVAASRDASPLFDTEWYRIHLESLFISMWRAHELNGVSDEVGGRA